jgi:hypothetical protein
MRRRYASTLPSGLRVGRRKHRSPSRTRSIPVSFRSANFGDTFFQQLLAPNSAVRACDHRLAIWRGGYVLRVLPGPYLGAADF